MTFKEYLDSIQKTNQISLIEEWCNGKLIVTHTSFGFQEPISDEDAIFIVNGIEINTKDDYALYGNNYENVPTFIDAHQTVKVNPEKEGIFVTDRDGNKINLVFFFASPFPHPKELVD
jgi:hypothetical protein